MPCYYLCAQIFPAPLQIARFDFMEWLRRQPVYLTVAASFGLLLLLWQGVVLLGAYDKFILPGPIRRGAAVGGCDS